MKAISQTYGRGEAGATLIEYALAFSLIVIVFIGVGLMLEHASKKAFKRNMSMQSEMEPCSSALGATFSADYDPC